MSVDQFEDIKYINRYYDTDTDIGNFKKSIAFTGSNLRGRLLVLVGDDTNPSIGYERIAVPSTSNNTLEKIYTSDSIYKMKRDSKGILDNDGKIVTGEYFCVVIGNPFSYTSSNKTYPAPFSGATVLSGNNAKDVSETSGIVFMLIKVNAPTSMQFNYRDMYIFDSYPEESYIKDFDKLHYVWKDQTELIDSFSHSHVVSNGQTPQFPSTQVNTKDTFPVDTSSSFVDRLVSGYDGLGFGVYMLINVSKKGQLDPVAGVSSDSAFRFAFRDVDGYSTTGEPNIAAAIYRKLDARNNTTNEPVTSKFYCRRLGNRFYTEYSSAKGFQEITYAKRNRYNEYFLFSSYNYKDYTGLGSASYSQDLYFFKASQSDTYVVEDNIVNQRYGSDGLSLNPATYLITFNMYGKPLSTDYSTRSYYYKVTAYDEDGNTQEDYIGDGKLAVMFTMPNNKKLFRINISSVLTSYRPVNCLTTTVIGLS